MGQMTAQCAMRLEEYSLEQLATVLAACVRARYTPAELLLPLQLRLRSEARGDMQEEAANVAAIATHLSRLRVGEERTWAALDAAAQACGPQLGLQHLVALLAARIRAGVVPTGTGSGTGTGGPRADEGSAASWLVERVERAAVADMQSASPQEVATLMWSLARCGRPPSRSLVRALRTHLDDRRQQQDAVEGDQRAAVGGGQSYSVVQLAAVAGACQKLGVEDRQLSWQLATHGAQALRDEATALRLPVPAAGGAGSRRATFTVERPAAPVDSQAVAVLVAGAKAVSGRPRPQPKPLTAAHAAAAEAPSGAAAATAPPQAAAAASSKSDEAFASLLRAAARMLLTLHEAGAFGATGSAESGGGRARLVGGLDMAHVAAVAEAAQDAGLADESATLHKLAVERS
ncbi:hypothetical protein HXX76_002491 [Chlamydomonas incerta]|uniref:Uncharacterized protein n=1 Tax=Chlamydomonas incerta TaxID=51695 RepID=A0A835W7L5_CHLIN|nr:hypothetical protein HXX76_002491 [Chlamydomonas incerta]|eukprot:KAG2442405.1 hypothetical protein HXX76_002491 [Chlamydomonas incerta]